MIPVEVRLPATDRSMEKSTDTSVFDAPGAAGRGVPWLARACAFAGAIACSGLAGPGTARAAGPVGIDVSAEIEAALAEVDAAVPQAPTREGQSVTLNDAGPTTVNISAPAAAEGVDADVAAATQPIVTAASAPISPTSTNPGSAPAAPARTGLARKRDAGKVSGRPKPPHPVVGVVSRSTLVSSAYSSVEVVVTSRTTRVGGEARSPGAPRARAKPNPPAGVEPQRLPPAPLPPRPDMTSSGQGGGQGSAQPLLLAALAAVLGFFVLSLLPRVLPRPAFRKPRRIVLPPWHPG
jgi:hypothetical protein